MDDISIIDRFFNVFSSYIDSGFGLLGSEVAWLASALIVIDITLAGLFWAFDENKNVLSSLIKKILYVGFFALIINNFQLLSNIIFNSFSGLGLKATGSSVSAAELLQPGRIAATGFEAAYPILTQIGDLLGPVAFFENFILIIVLLFAWFLVVLAFFILAIQIFITILEFKITTLAGFVLIPFALWNKTSFLAERVLGGVISSGIKVMALAIIIGIGSLIFADFAAAMNGTEATLKNAMSLVLGALSLLGLSIFAPAIAAGLVSGAPQLGAGAAVGTVAAGGAAMAVGMGAGAMAAKGAASMASSAVNAGAKVAGQASGAYNLSKATSNAKTATGGMTSGIKGVGQSFANSVKQKASAPLNAVKESYSQGQRTAWETTGGGSSASAAPSSENTMPDWARRMKSAQAVKSAGTMSLHAMKDGDRPGSSANPSLNTNNE
ncbi:P-type conjugative transfer protein TrbL [Paremcibacter congregatus]|uniref:P-type conjugative transfer protein TrbL n=1 Tax=Paremcibacter congregatus TaxID=2043170 RepID=A0A2G4YNV4_9PROT|nr:P-type conjugative transfer protein TrbL [Paremcibacter congregatus]PHZ84012.1 P-type conjugative transfer protein TrbL [Paremcibacter congregatus]QDE26287.1 P-type conjugative transfer protein TrbL [Paremcibacter congregatus]